MGITCLGCKMLTTLCVLHHCASVQIPDITAQVKGVPEIFKGLADQKIDLSISCNLVPPPSEGVSGKFFYSLKFITVSPYVLIKINS